MTSIKTMKRVALYLLGSLVIISLYTEVSHFFVGCGGLKRSLYHLELPLISLLLLLFYFPSIGLAKNILLSSTAVVSLYFLHDMFYAYMSRSPRISDLKNAFMIGDYSIFMMLEFTALTLMIFLPILYMIWLSRKDPNRTSVVHIIVKVFISILFISLINISTVSKYFLEKFDYIEWSQSSTIRKNGRLASTIFYSILSRQAISKLKHYTKYREDIDRTLFATHSIRNRPNIYFVVLESFIDPRLIKNASFTPSPLATTMKKYLRNGEFSYIIASIYGGGTAQSEFEVLTGIKALGKIDTVDFNTIGTHPLPGFTHFLKKNGYATYAVIASDSGYYNSKTAYRSIGIDQVSFLKENNDFRQTSNDKLIFDGDLYRYSINKIEHLDKRQPYFFYLLGMYGHVPYERNPKVRPDIIAVKGISDSRITDIANQFYYRTKALTHYIDSILSYDPSAVIYITSDHLPPLLDKNIRYKKEKHTNIALLLVHGRFVNISGYHYYEIPRLITKLLNNDDHPLESIDDKTMEQLYYQALAQSLGF